jgi:hypothetical protein
MDQGGVLSRWPIEWVRELAVIAPEHQAEIVRHQGCRLDRITLVTALRALINEEMRPLSKVPWDLSREDLLPQAGSCLGCPKNSARTPYLLDENAQPIPASGRCRDGSCYAAKMNAWRTELVCAKRANPEIGERLLCTWSFKPGEYIDGDRLLVEKKIGQKIIDLADLKLVSKKMPMAIPVLAIAGSMAGEIRYAVRRADAGSGRSRAKKMRPGSVAELRERLELRRRAATVLEVAEILDRFDMSKIADDDRLLALIAAFGCDEVRPRPMKGSSERWHGMHLALIARREQLTAIVLARVRARHLRAWQARSPEAGLVAKDVCDLLDVPWQTMLASQMQKIPEPSSWGRAARTTDPKITTPKAIRSMARRRKSRS